MATLSDAIEAYLLTQLNKAPGGFIEIQRAELAERFGCVPSQVTYVLVTRFTPERGYLVEARRGGGGGIRISRLQAGYHEVHALFRDLVAIDQARAEHIVRRLREGGLLTDREAQMASVAMHRDTLDVPLPERDRIRARLLRAMLTVLFKVEEAH